ncbi:hypothetical protein CQZ88_09985 [Rhodococcus sp. ENV425]|nr:hypothetical protein CQZ88_09985 [Rhodococcus sp. ENV425]CCW11376.1 hypothetical protein EBESD8_19140 [Rhodococcus aetherivorans]
MHTDGAVVDEQPFATQDEAGAWARTHPWTLPDRGMGWEQAGRSSSLAGEGSYPIGGRRLCTAHPGLNLRVH